MQKFFYDEPHINPLNEFYALLNNHYPLRISQKDLIAHLKELENYDETTPEGLSVLHGCCAYGLNDGVRLLFD